MGDMGSWLRSGILRHARLETLLDRGFIGNLQTKYVCPMLNNFFQRTSVPVRKELPLSNCMPAMTAVEVGSP